MTECVFCRILANELPASPVSDNESVVAFLDINPVNAGHTLVVPRRHAPFLSDLTITEVQEMAALGQRIAAAQRRALGCEGVSLFLADGEVAGREVFHAHLHVIPRHRQDGFGLTLPASYGVESRERLDKTAGQLRLALGL